MALYLPFFAGAAASTSSLARLPLVLETGMSKVSASVSPGAILYDMFLFCSGGASLRGVEKGSASVQAQNKME